MRVVRKFLLVLLWAPMAVWSAEAMPEGASAYVGVTTNYVYRGVSYTSDHKFYHRTSTMTPDGGMGRFHTTSTTRDEEILAPAVYGGFDYLHTSGLYASVALSSIDIPGSDASLLAEGSAGYAWKHGSGWRGDVGAIVHVFPGDSDVNYGEVYAGGGYGPVGAKVWYDPANRDLYVRATVSFDLGSDFELDLFAGHYAFDDGPDYEDYGVRLSRAFGAWRAGIALTDTSLDRAIPYAWIAYRVRF